MELRFAGALIHTQHLGLSRALTAAGEDADQRAEEAAQHNTNRKTQERRFLHAEKWNGTRRQKSRKLGDTRCTGRGRIRRATILLRFSIVEACHAAALVVRN
jgi:hypothetical protein